MRPASAVTVQVFTTTSSAPAFSPASLQPRRTSEHESDLTVVAYTLHSSEADDTFELYRWTSPQLPESLDRSFPSRDDDSSVLLAEGLLDFGVSFTGEDVEDSSSWDSTTMVGSSTLPTSIEITVAIAPTDTSDPEDAPRYRKTVLLPMRPLDIAAMLQPDAPSQEEADEDGSDDGDGGERSGELTMADCFNFGAIDPDTAESYASFSEFAQANMSQPWSEVRGMIPSQLLVYVYAEPECQ